MYQKMDNLLKIYPSASEEDKGIICKLMDDIDTVIERTNKDYIPLYENESRYLVLMGGGGSGKSIFAGSKLLWRIVNEKSHRMLVVRKVARTLRESCFQQLKGHIHDYYNISDFDINKTDMKITYKPNGNEILFSGLDDIEKLKSIYNLTGIWIEEASELEPEDFRQLDIRLRGQTTNYKQMIFSFNPVNITHWLKKEFFDGQKDDTTTSHTTYLNNKFLDAEAIKVLKSFEVTDPYYYQVYCLGQWGTLGNTIFDAEKVNKRIAYLRTQEPLKCGFFVYEYVNEKIVDASIKWQDATKGDGYITIYDDVLKGYPYVIGADTSGDGSDYFGAHVINNNTGKQIAVMHKQNIDEDLFTKQIYCLGRYYNDALIGIESNFSTYPIKELQRLNYPRQYMREEEDKITNRIEKRFGFRTTKVTRPLIIAELVELVREDTNLIFDIPTLTEMLSFVRNEKGRPEAQSGAHDDLIMSLAITYYIRTQQSYSVSVDAPKKVELLIDQIKKKNIRGVL